MSKRTRTLEEPKKFPLKLRFQGEVADQRGVDLYDGATSLYGFAQALQIAVHAYMSNEIVSRATAIKQAQMYMGAPKRGSVLVGMVAMIEAYPVTAALTGAAFYEFLKYSLSKAVGYVVPKPESPSVQKIALSADETFFDQLAETLEGSLQRAHRAIDHGVPSIQLERPRAPLVTFNQETSEWVNTRDEDPDIVELTGNITRYNSISGNGRAFVRELKKVLPFRKSSSFPEHKRGLLTRSLHGDNVAAAKDLKFWASKIESANGAAKRLILADIAQRSP